MSASVIDSSIKRNDRTNKNGYIDLDINISPGNEYCQWIETTKNKLKEREIQLLSAKMGEIERIVNQTVKNNVHSYKISDILIHAIFNEFLFPVIDRWNGVNMAKIKREIIKFRDYFAVGKNWWDLSKRRLLGSMFWVKIFEDIDKV